jgi:RIO-like serine/threonine protein kinase
MLYPSIPIEEDRTLEVIRAFTDSQIERLPIEDRILQVHKTELRRPVMYFWSAHDFVLGLRDAIIGASVHLLFLNSEIIWYSGHAYLVDIGILHRDVSENNIVLGCHPKDTRGYIMDLDMAIPYRPQSSSQPRDLQAILDEVKLEAQTQESSNDITNAGTIQS